MMAHTFAQSAAPVITSLIKYTSQGSQLLRNRTFNFLPMFVARMRAFLSYPQAVKWVLTHIAGPIERFCLIWMPCTRKVWRLPAPAGPLWKNNIMKLTFRFFSSFLLILISTLLLACNSPSPSTEPDDFMAALAQHCGQAFAGRVINDEPAAADSPFAGQALIMHVRECRDNELYIPFHVGDDHSRTWIVTRTEDGVRLKHDHRHEDGSDDAVTMYGGDSVTAGTVIRQEFPVDSFSIEMFEREGLDVSVTNVWAMEIEPGNRFLYELGRPGGRLFQVEFDLTTPVPAPPAPWGHE
jgi:hypothetical protein